MATFQPSTHSNPGVRMGAGPPTGTYRVSLLGERGMAPDGWHWGVLEGRVPETVKIKGPLVPGRRIQFRRLTGNTAPQWAVFVARKRMLAHGGGPAMGPGLVSHDQHSWHPGVRVVVPPASAMKVNPLPAGLGTAAAVGGVAMIPLIIAGVLALPTFVVNPLLVKAFKPKWSYGRRVLAGIPLGMVMGLGFAATRKLAKSME